MAVKIQVFMDDRRGHGRANNLQLQKKINDWYNNDAPNAPLEMSAVLNETTIQSDDCTIHFVMYDDA
jgi:hypothetical protein